MPELPKPVLLIVDDDTSVIRLVEQFVHDQGFDVITRTGGLQLLAELPHLKPDVALVDLRMPEVGGLDLFRAIREVHPTCHVILMTAQATVDSAIEAVKLGALDFVSKPFDWDRLRGLFDTVRYGLARRQRLLAADSELASQFEFNGMVGRSPVMQELFDSIRRLAPHVRTALITGETGTGKELVARGLHRLGRRRDRRFVTSNCSAIAETLFESEFFGHTRGAFTGASDAKAGLFENADGGTLFLDEIGELPITAQPKLLRAVEYGEVKRVGAPDTKRIDICVIAATNRHMREHVASGRFRQDLYYRLNIVEFALPPLREHRDDIPYLTATFVREFAKRFDKTITGVSPGAERLLQNAPWPGNVRELRNVLERSCMASESRLLTERDVLTALSGHHGPTAAAAAAVPAPPRSNGAAQPEVTRDQVEQALQQVGGNRSQAARRLGISRRALYRRLDTFGLR
jgi:two-component system, NtrC family, response regulator HydG